jgi:hypothetical protein
MVQVRELGTKNRKVLPPEKMEELVKKMRKDGEKMVNGMFEFSEAQGGYIEFSYRFFKGEPISTIRIVHGEICDLPAIIVKHINNTYKKVRMFGEDNPATNSPNAGRMLPSKGNPSHIYQKTSRIRFIPTDVM